jgi:hypothetical protein
MSILKNTVVLADYVRNVTLKGQVKQHDGSMADISHDVFVEYDHTLTKAFTAFIHHSINVKGSKDPIDSNTHIYEYANSIVRSCNDNSMLADHWRNVSSFATMSDQNILQAYGKIKQSNKSFGDPFGAEYLQKTELSLEDRNAHLSRRAYYDYLKLRSVLIHGKPSSTFTSKMPQKLIDSICSILISSRTNSKLQPLAIALVIVEDSLTADKTMSLKQHMLTVVISQMLACGLNKISNAQAYSLLSMQYPSFWFYIAFVNALKDNDMTMRFIDLLAVDLVESKMEDISFDGFVASTSITKGDKFISMNDGPLVHTIASKELSEVDKITIFDPAKSNFKIMTSSAGMPKNIGSMGIGGNVILTSIGDVYDTNLVHYFSDTSRLYNLKVSESLSTSFLINLRKKAQTLRDGGANTTLINTLSEWEDVKLTTMAKSLTFTR